MKKLIWIPLLALPVIFVAAPALISAIYRVKTNASSTQISKGWGA